MASFLKMSLLTCPCLRRKRVENSGTLDDLQKQHLDWQAREIVVFDVFFFFGFLKSSVWFMRLKQGGGRGGKGGHDSNSAQYLFRVPMIHRFMTSSKLLLILTNNYNTYLKMYRSRTCVDWCLTFTVGKKKQYYDLQ